MSTKKLNNNKKRKKAKRVNLYNTTEKNQLCPNLRELWISIKMNYIFIIIIFVCIYILNYFNPHIPQYYYSTSLFSFFLAMFIWMVSTLYITHCRF